MLVIESWIGFDWPQARVGRYCRPRPAQTAVRGVSIMPTDITDAALDFLLARAGLDLTDTEKAELKTVYAGIAQMAERVRQPRGRMAELARVYNFTAADFGEDLA
jgi:hypothetical protein